MIFLGQHKWEGTIYIDYDNQTIRKFGSFLKSFKYIMYSLFSISAKLIKRKESKILIFEGKLSSISF
jgi:hypothetical protein